MDGYATNRERNAFGTPSLSWTELSSVCVLRRQGQGTTGFRYFWSSAPGRVKTEARCLSTPPLVCLLVTIGMFTSIVSVMCLRFVWPVVLGAWK